MDESLRRAAREGNVNDLYALIKRDGNVLRRIDEVEFIDSPLHIAADAGCIDFAMEIMSLKPSFGRKLNHDGLSPIHLALEKGHNELVLNLLENAKDLVRVKGKKGETPLHYVITREENPQLLIRFLEDCPESIRDLTTGNQSALHIAARNNKEEALKILCKMLRKTDYCQDVVNQKDRNGDTALHMAARDNRHEMVKLLLKCKADKHAANQAGSTPLDVAQQYNNRESIGILRRCFIPKVSALINKLQKQIFRHVTKASMVVFQDMDNISSEDRNALLVILGLLLTATYQASLSPPGSVWQGDGPSNLTGTERNFKRSLGTPGTSVMDQTNFLQFYIPSCAVFTVTFFLTLGLLEPFPRGFRTALQVLLALLAVCFYESIVFLAPTALAAGIIYAFSVTVLVLMMFMCFAYRVSKISVLIPGCFLIPFGGPIIASILLFIYDEFWKGSVLVVGYCLLLFMRRHHQTIISASIVLGCWSFLGLSRFCIKRCIERL
ncbi:hypothetical protein PTKIN_Ptkin16aG0497200 [Pterospermum kingtungense]